jgi:hypothetical protein
MSPFASMRRLKRGPVTPGLAAALGAGVVLHTAGIALVGATWRLPAPPAPPSVFVRAEPPNSAMNEQAELMDPSPLFLPTALNHGAGYKPDATDEEQPHLPSIEQRTGAPPQWEPVSPVLSKKYARRTPEEQLPRASGDTFLTFGRTPPATESLKPLGAKLVMRDEATGEALGEIPISVVGLTPNAEKVRAPAVFFVESDAYGISPPILRKSSGDGECDRKLAEAVAAQLASRPPKPGRMLVTAAP